MYEVVIKKHFYYAIIAFVCVMSFMYKDSFIIRAGGSLISYATYPFLYSYAFLDASLHQWSLRLQGQAALKEVIEQLELKNKQLQAELVSVQATKVYADSIQELLLFKERYNLTGGIIAQVLSATCTEYEQTVIVNAGYHHGVVKNMVLLAHNCLIGKVIEVYPWYSKVRLITDARCKVSALCASTGATGIHQGNNSGVTTLEHVTHLDVVKEGDIVLSTGKGLVFPQGFALGTVVQASLNGLVHHITIQPLFSPQALSYCLLISKELCEKH